MKQHISIQLKAALLLIVFSLNTIIGFACAAGIDMGFNSKSNQEIVTTAVVPEHDHANRTKHHHPHDAGNQHKEEKKSAKKGGCCNNEVVKFQHIEKNINPNAMIAIGKLFSIAITSTFFSVNVFNHHPAPQKDIVRLFYPPPPDILITIQRFQI